MSKPTNSERQPIPLTEETAKFLMDHTWAEAMKTAARLARELAQGLPPGVDGPTALRAYAATCEKQIADGADERGEGLA